MVEILSLLDQALDSGHEELKYLLEENVDAAFEAAEKRGEYINQALENKGETNPQKVLGKLEELKLLQESLTAEAQKFHASLKNDLGRLKKEKVRLNGYGKASGRASLYNYFKKVG